MRRRLPLALALLLAGLVVAPPPASAAELSGQVVAASGGALPDIEVRAWRDDDGKGFDIVATSRTGDDGAWTLGDLAEGVYLLDARMAAGVTGNWADRWYDEAEPFADGYIAAAADRISLAQDDVLAGFTLTLELAGGLDGRVLAGDQPVSGLWARVERASAYDVHHNDRTDEPCCSDVDEYGGRFFMRGLPPADDYRVLVYDDTGRFGLNRFDGPYAVRSDANAEVGDLGLVEAAADPNEPNERAADAGAGVPAGPFTPSGAGVWASEGAAIAPRGGDIDWYCFDVSDDERLLLRVDTDIEPGRAHPWLDPVLSLRTGDGTTELAQVDDSDGTRNPALDTADLELPNRVCVVVTMYGDAAFDGTNHESAGAYTLRVERGNRRPSIRAEVAGGPAPEPPGTVLGTEGETLAIVARFADPDGDELSFTATAIDALGGETATTDEPIPDGRRVALTFDETAAARSPFEVTLTVDDGEFAASARVLVAVRAVNQPPGPPVPVSPIDDVQVDTDIPALVVEAAEDPDTDPLTYRFEVHVGEPDETPRESGDVTPDADGRIAFGTTALPENARISWRARASDGLDGGIGPWTAWQSFVVDALAEPPGTPAIVKPTPGETVLSATPAIQAENVDDPDGDDITLEFAVATDDAFTEIVAESSVPQESTAARTVWAVPEPLERGTNYLVRVRALDDDGLRSPWSTPVAFSVQTNRAPDAPVFGAPFDPVCRDVVLVASDPLVVTVTPARDPDGDALTIELDVFGFDDDAEIAPPRASLAQPEQGNEGTVFEIPASAFVVGERLRIRARASDGLRTSPWASCDGWWGERGAPTTQGSGDGSGVGSGDGGGDVDGQEDERQSVTPSLCACSARHQSPSERRGATLLAVMVLVALRRRG